MLLRHFYHVDSGSFSYVISDKKSSECVIIDPVLGYDYSSGELKSGNVGDIISFISNNNLVPKYVLDTHVHADRLSAIGVLKNYYKIPIGIGYNIVKMVDFWSTALNRDDIDPKRYYDLLLNDNDKLMIGGEPITVIFTPGHTISCVSYVFANLIFVGDTLFRPSRGTARADFPGANVEMLYKAIKNRIYSFPDDYRIMLCHDYVNRGEIYENAHSVSDHKSDNVLISEDTSVDDFVKIRSMRDQSLSCPKVMNIAVQFNLNAGFLKKSPLDKNRGFLTMPVYVRSEMIDILSSIFIDG